MYKIAIISCKYSSIESTIQYRKIYDLTWFYFSVIFKTLIHSTPAELNACNALRGNEG
ncbi:MAG: hypothetical protein ACNYWM_07650 [Methanosarcinales archaeon]